MLSDIQYAFLMGRQRTGVSCHIYLEYQVAEFNPDKGIQVWKSICDRHRAVQYCVNFLGIVTEDLNKSTAENVFVTELYDIEQLIELRGKQKSRILDIEQGKLAGFVICKLKDGPWHLMFDFDCVGYDVTSYQIFLRDYWNMYEGRILPELPNTYDPNERPVLNQEERKQAKEYWKRKIDRMENEPLFPINAGYKEKRPATYTAHERYISAKIWKWAEVAAVEYRTSTELVLLSIFAKVIHKITGKNSFLLNLPLLKRVHLPEKLWNVMGDFTEILIFQVSCTKWEHLEDVVRKLTTDYEKDYANRAFSGVAVQKMTSDVPITFSSHIEVPMNGPKLEYFATQTPMVTMDSQFYLFNGQLYVALVTVDGYFENGLEEQILDGIEQEMSDLEKRSRGKILWTLEQK